MTGNDHRSPAGRGADEDEDRTGGGLLDGLPEPGRGAAARPDPGRPAAPQRGNPFHTPPARPAPGRAGTERPNVIPFRGAPQPPEEPPPGRAARPAERAPATGGAHAAPAAPPPPAPGPAAPVPPAAPQTPEPAAAPQAAQAAAAPAEPPAPENPQADVNASAAAPLPEHPDPAPEPAAAAQAPPQPPVPEAPPAAEPGRPAAGADRNAFSGAERDAVYRAIRERRDVRVGFRPDPVPDEVLTRVLDAAHQAPSVGFSQPWDFVVIQDEEVRRRVHGLVSEQRDAYAGALPAARARAFSGLKVEAILDTPVNVAVTVDPTRGGRHTLGRHAQPQT